TQRTVTVRVYDVHKGKELFASRGIQMSDGAVGVPPQRGPQRGPQRPQEDIVAAAVDKFLETLDTRLKMTDLPEELTSDVAMRRIKALLSSNEWHPLVGLAEVRLYEKHDLLEPERVVPLLAPMLGEKAADFFAEEPEKREAAV